MKAPQFKTEEDVVMKNVRAALICITVCSVFNVFLSAFSGYYLLFSSYISQIFGIIGYKMYVTTSVAIYPIVFGLVGLLFIVPYFLAFLFTKRHVGWIISALIYFGIDTLIYVPDLISALIYGADIFSTVLEIFIRIYCIYCLVKGVIARRRQAKAPEVQPTPINEVVEDDPFAPKRTITVRRKKSFNGMAIAWVCFVNRQPVCRLKNGETQSFEAPASDFSLEICAENGYASGSIRVSEYSTARNFLARQKSKIMSVEIIIEPDTKM